MLKSSKLFQPRLVSGIFGGYVPNSSIVPINNKSGNILIQSRYAGTTTKTMDKKLPDPSQAIISHKAFHYSTFGLVTCLPVSLLLPTSGLTAIADILLSVFIPTHFFLGMNSVINDYIYQSFLRAGSKLLVGGCAFIILGGILTMTKNGVGLGGTIKALWK
ncbi:succinate dehydrogenase [Tieghemostelium lacteum]|uniref:Succinate dehydrogenase [ubiquinone] cytochrome b small subunit n=1 Tax=Tieghemostelium lacteum TaxID=361077 RepID=A0A152A968_TIELA|nr:succinate dehydrogenase [Tieghemostelium lacteum]|eukprot:KYR02769.1 succinate dehydrogenase [Tieghemostelium lacteum]